MINNLMNKIFGNIFGNWRLKDIKYLIYWTISLMILLQLQKKVKKSIAKKKLMINLTEDLHPNNMITKMVDPMTRKNII